MQLPHLFLPLEVNVLQGPEVYLTREVCQSDGEFPEESLLGRFADEGVVGMDDWPMDEEGLLMGFMGLYQESNQFGSEDIALYFRLISSLSQDQLVIIENDPVGIVSDGISDAVIIPDFDADLLQVFPFD